MKFKEAAYEILKQAGKPLHSNEITKIALERNLILPGGPTPESSMASMLYTNTLRQYSRFRRGDKPGTFVLKTLVSAPIQQQIENLNQQVKAKLRKQLLLLSPQKFEELIRLLLDEMGFEETETTAYSNDKGVDVRGVLRSNPLSEVKIAIQAKRWTHNVGSGVVRDLRGSLKVADSEQGLIITPGDFSVSAVEESQSSGKTPIRLINGVQLVDLLAQYNVGIKTEEYTIPVIDNEYWTEVLGVVFPEEEVTEVLPAQKKEKALKRVLDSTFPLAIQASHKGKTYLGKLINIEGQVKYNDQIFQTPTAAAKAIVEWKTVNGWDFWRFIDPKSGALERIGKLR